MPVQNILTSAPPYPVEEALKRLGANLRTARIRRKMTQQNVADKIGISRFVVAGAELGKPSTAAVVYVALLWAYDLLDQLEPVAAPSQDKEGLALSIAGEHRRVRPSEALDDDF